MIDTKKAAGRRTLRLANLDELAAEVERLAAAREVRALGNWTPGQVLRHLALSMNCSIDGFGGFSPVPGFVRPFLRPFKRYFMKAKMPPGFKLPASGQALQPPPTTLAEGVAAIRTALARLHAEDRRSPNPVLGKLTAAEWEQVHLRHSEMHLSFLAPSDG